MHHKCRTPVHMVFSVLGSIITSRFPMRRAVKGLLQPQDATSRHRVFVPHSCGDRLYLHPALTRARGQRLITILDLAMLRSPAMAISRFFSGRTDQSLRGQTLLLEKSTSHGIVLSVSYHGSAGGSSPL